MSALILLHPSVPLHERYAVCGFMLNHGYAPVYVNNSFTTPVSFRFDPALCEPVVGKRGGRNLTMSDLNSLRSKR